MTIDECVESWINGNLTHVVEYVLGLDSPVQIAYYSAGIVVKLQALNEDEPQIFLNLFAARM